MADTRISALTRLPEADLSATDLLPVSDLSASETKAITTKDLFQGGLALIDPGSIPIGKLDVSLGLDPAVLHSNQTDVVLGVSSTPGPIQELRCTQLGRDILASADSATLRSALGLGNLADKTGSWVNGSSFSGTSSGTNTGDQTITLTGAVNGSGTGSFVTTLGDNAVLTRSITDAAITAIKIGTDAVTAEKLADQSAGIVVSGPPTTPGDFIGQGAFNELTNVSYTYTANGWVEHAGARSVSVSEVGTPLNFAVTNGSVLGIDVTLDLQQANRFWAGPSSGGDAAPTFRRIADVDLPLATSSAVGAIKPGATLSVTADGTTNIVPATTTTIGGVSVVAGGSLSIGAQGQLTHLSSNVTPGTYAKVEIDARGHVVSGGPLTASDLPPHDASLLISGTLNRALIADRSISVQQLMDYSTTLVQENTPSALVGAYPIGTQWLKESTGEVAVWNGNSWMRTGGSLLYNKNLRYGGTYDASTGLVTGVTQLGTAEGIVVGNAVPGANDSNAGLYFVASAPGNNISYANNAVFDAGDWLLSHGLAAGFVRINTLNSGGGGGAGGSSTLADLLDVVLGTPTEGDLLVYGSNGQWVNRSILDEGTWS